MHTRMKAFRIKILFNMQVNEKKNGVLLALAYLCIYKTMHIQRTKEKKS